MWSVALSNDRNQRNDRKCSNDDDGFHWFVRESPNLLISDIFVGLSRRFIISDKICPFFAKFLRDCRENVSYCANFWIF